MQKNRLENGRKGKKMCFRLKLYFAIDWHWKCDRHKPILLHFQTEILVNAMLIPFHSKWNLLHESNANEKIMFYAFSDHFRTNLYSQSVNFWRIYPAIMKRISHCSIQKMAYERHHADPLYICLQSIFHPNRVSIEWWNCDITC